jgi:hypothetical protein
MRLRTHWIRRLFLRGRLILWTAATMLTVMGVVTFPLFIMEEAVQMAMYGTWQAKDNYTLLYQGVKCVQGINASIRTLNDFCGWVHPFSFLSYRCFTQATDYWVQANIQKILANAPEVLSGETVTLLFTPENVTFTDSTTILSNGKIIVIEPRLLKPPIPAIITGTVTIQPSGQVEIHAR